MLLDFHTRMLLIWFDQTGINVNYQKRQSSRTDAGLIVIKLRGPGEKEHAGAMSALGQKPTSRLRGEESALYRKQTFYPDHRVAYFATTVTVSHLPARRWSTEPSRSRQ
jgi:hypothetical protein